MICYANWIKHRLTKLVNLWINGQFERINRTIKEATVKLYQYGSQDQLRTHLGDFMAAGNLARIHKTLSSLTPFEFTCKIWTSGPDRLTIDPSHQMPGQNKYR
ncbi:hypothetical protein RUM4293_03591 [Ruegeria atlantica]|uniref:Integrase catalytic domain-containing protein n=2 Tax=Ruegeria atlantica TaxID=81569 RepID=A0A0P1ESP9_9RHOB|nr:hypothetical protein RUM4293_03591 [Ruegeria atlantica]